MRPTFLETALRTALDDPALRVLETAAVGGGCIHDAARVRTTAGDFFAKWNHEGAADQFLREAEGLAALRAADAELIVPRVIAASAPAGGEPGYLVLECLPSGPGRPGDEERLGRGLAHVHRCTAERFGFPAPTYCGTTRQDNTPADSWAEFYSERRLRPLARALHEAGSFSSSDRSLVERLAGRLSGLVASDAPPSLVHGDLWSGNVLATPLGPAIVDPACCHADREMEFGITTLFGGLSARAFAAYEEAWPLPTGWRERNGLYQLYHLLNHALLFGGGYVGQARAAARRY